MLAARTARSAFLLRSAQSTPCFGPQIRASLSPLQSLLTSSQPRHRTRLQQPQPPSPSLRRSFRLPPCTAKGLQPDSEDPAPPKSHLHQAPDGIQPTEEPAEITPDEYHEIADLYMDELVTVLEEKAESGQSGFEVDYSAGVLNLTTPHGSYVINKQPPNRQIWVSSPVSGPKRYDWVLATNEGQNQKADTGLDIEGDMRGGRWVYLRDGTRMTDWLKRELDLVVGKDGEGEGPV